MPHHRYPSRRWRHRRGNDARLPRHRDQPQWAGCNIANATTVTICDPAVAACISDFTIQADVSATQVVADVQGYFRNVRLSQLSLPNNPNQVAVLRWYAANQTAEFPVSFAPNGVAFDGAHIWVASYSRVTELRASDGATLALLTLGTDLWGVAFDGASIWVTNHAGTGSVSKR